jgi:cobalt-zinc-cadmium resistance protein CzcA
VLFGVAVLNGLVLISRFNSLKIDGIMDIKERIITATHERIRPILLTATAAMFGFLPMAISSSAGAEVQRPLATVVIGGLFSATLLTLIVVPILYALVESGNEKRKKRKGMGSVTAIVFLALMSTTLFAIPNKGYAQALEPKSKISLNEAIKKAIANYPALKVARLEVENQEVLKKTAWDIGATELATGSEELGNNTPDGIYNKFMIRQEFDVFGISAKNKVANAKIEMSKTSLYLSALEIKREVSIAWGDALDARNRFRLYRRLDSIFKISERAAKLRLETQAISRLEYLSVSNQAKQINISMEKSYRDFNIALWNLNRWFVSDTVFTIEPSSAELYKLPLSGLPDSIGKHPILKLYDQNIRLAGANFRMAKSGFAPKLSAEYGIQEIGNQKGFYKYQFGISIPLVFASQMGKTQSAKIQQQIAREGYQQKAIEVQTEYRNLYNDYQKWLITWHYFHDDALPTAIEQKNGAIMAYEQGAIDYVSFLQNIRDAVQIEFEAQNALASYLNARFRLEYYINSTR